MAEKVTHLWAEINEKNRLDLSDQRLSDDDVDKILKGLHMIAKTSGFLTERTRPFPLTEIDFSGNEITRKGVGEVVQFARTQGCKAALVDLSKNRLDDEAALEELSRLVKNYGSFSHNNFLGELLLSGNKIGREGATKLIQYAHWERDRRNSSKPDEPKISMKLDLSDNCIESPAELIEELNKKRIRCSDSADKEEDTTVHLPDFTDQRPPISRQPPARGPNSARPRGGYGGGGGGYGGGGYRGRDDRRGGGGYGGGYARERDPRGGRDYGGPSYDRPPPRERDYGRRSPSREYERRRRSPSRDRRSPSRDRRSPSRDRREREYDRRDRYDERGGGRGRDDDKSDDDRGGDRNSVSAKC